MLVFKHIKFAYLAGGKVYSVTTGKTVENSRVKLKVENTGGVISASVETATPITLLRLSAEFEYDFKSVSRIFLNGYQSWTDSVEHTTADRLHGIGHIPKPLADRYAFSQYGDYTFTHYSMKKGSMHGFSYGYVRNYDVYDFIGSLNEQSGFTTIRTECSAGKLLAFKECNDLKIENSFDGLKLYIGQGSEDEVFDEWFRLMGIARRPASPVKGYTSWYRHYQDISEEILTADMEGSELSEEDIFQIDDGWQTAVGDWLSVDKEKFPNGMKAMTDKLKECGKGRAGLWLAPFVCEEKSVLFREHQDWLVKDKNGRPVKAGSNWSGFYALDIYKEDFRAYLKEVFDTIIGEWGFCGLLKLDFLYGACIVPREDKTRGMIMADGMKLLRELAGDTPILGCGVPLASAFGMAEYCRVGCDVALDWDDKPYMKFMHRERPSTKNCILNSVFRRQLNKRAFLLDPDVYLLRDTETSMTADQRRCLIGINTLTGGVLFTSDNAAEYSDEQKQMYEEAAKLAGRKIISAELNGSELILRLGGEEGTEIKTYDMSALPDIGIKRLLGQ
ncbi:glycoside hydrolase family 36 protein [Ruminococcus sp.]|uniref:glycoside hydrolase family 36 protein n=1 Tax=Ruminococcus sp. TaxID=41978 RepID=UPI0025F4E1A9|nr:glycoside hydrolase family 36 protein [Ruminococcus sp.]MBQ8966602.1 alpha-galactosidase [Ruminococcus sp.]